jgi:Ca-activated chloride channel family protein
MGTRVVRYGLFLALLLAGAAFAGGGPDELYLQGRYDEAARIYARLAADNPGDVRYRFNQGCAAYQSSDYRGALAAFLGVLEAARDDEIRFRALFNLGNAAFRLGDYEGAVGYYRQALLQNPDSADAQTNVGLALKEAGKARMAASPAKGGEKSATPQRPGTAEDRGNARSEEGERERRPPPDGRAGPGPPRAAGQTERAPGERTNGASELTGASGSKARGKQGGEPSGSLEASRPLGEGEGPQPGYPVVASALDRRRAEALLDNVMEDRSRLLRSRPGEDLPHGTRSGKDW